MVGARYSGGTGAAYLYLNDGNGNWQLQVKLIANDAAAGDNFGSSVALFGSTALIGAWGDNDGGPSTGSAYIFSDDDSGNWSQQAKLTAADEAAFDDRFGYSVSLYGDTALIGAYMAGEYGDENGANSGAAYIFTDDGLGNWSRQARLTSADATADDLFGRSVAIDGDTVLVGALGDDDNGSYSGSAYIFTRDAYGSWSQQAKLIATDGAAGDWFGDSVSVYGDTALVGAHLDDDNNENSGSAYIFTHDGFGNWSQHAKLTVADGGAYYYFGNSVSLYGDVALVGSYRYGSNSFGSGSAYIFSDDGSGNWTQQQKLVANDAAAADYFGSSVAISGTT
ncbi:MAG: hypothetical protein GY820_44500, partial [Gammaproteobacteria bacterium]|nr:hypothetical protein [Gammaproteobacteria bacterium]